MSSGNNSDNDSDSDSVTSSVMNENELANELMHSEQYGNIFNTMVQARALTLSGENSEERAKHMTVDGLLYNGWDDEDADGRDALILTQIGTTIVFLERELSRAQREGNVSKSEQIQNYLTQLRQYNTNFMNTNPDSDQASELDRNNHFDFGDLDSDSEPNSPNYPAQGGRKRKTRKTRKSEKSKKSGKSKKSRKSKKAKKSKKSKKTRKSRKY